MKVGGHPSLRKRLLAKKIEVPDPVSVRPDPDAPTRERLLFRLKTRGPQTASALAERENLTPTAVRQHLVELEAEGLVAGQAEAGGRGRPARRWSLTEAAESRFPEGYADFAVELIGSIEQAFGRKGLDQLTRARTRLQRKSYHEELAGHSELAKRVAGLVRIRSREGYLAEWKRQGDDLLLIENHCPVCAAAQVCQGICGGELEVFRAMLPEARVERTEHILDGARRCVYRITPL